MTVTRPTRVRTSRGPVARMAALRRQLRGAAILAVAGTSVGMILTGIWMVFVPAGLIATGITFLAALTFDPAAVRKLTWPR